MRSLYKLGIVAAIVGVLFASANVLAERVAEDRVADAVAREFDLSRRPEVDLSGFPILFRLLRGGLPDVRFSARSIVAGDLQIASLSVGLTRLDGEGSILKGPYSITVGKGSATVVVDEEGVNALLASRDEDATVRINKGAVRVNTEIEFRGRRKVSAAARVQLRGNRLLITPVPGSVTVDGEPAPPSLEAEARRAATSDIQLPTLPGGIKPTSLTLTPGEVTLTAVLDARTIEVRK